MTSCVQGTTPLLRKAISGFRKALGTQVNIAKIIESEVPALPVYTKSVEPMIRADLAAGVMRDEWHKKLGKVFARFKNNETEGVLAHALLPDSAGELFPNPKVAAGGAKFRDFMVDLLGEVGFSREQALKFLTSDLPKLRDVGGDITRLDPHNINPNTFQALREEIANGSLRVTQNNGYAFGWDLINAIARTKHMAPVIREVRKTVGKWRGGVEGVASADVIAAQNFLNEFIDARISHSDKLVESTVQLFNGLLDNLVDAGMPVAARGKLNPDTIIDAANAATAYFSGFAMSVNPALVIRQVMQPVLGGFKVGFDTAFEGYNLAYKRGKAGEALRAEAAEALGIPLSAGAPVMLVETGESVMASKVGRAVMRAQQVGLIPYRWGDKMNRIVSYHQGKLAIEKNAGDLISGKADWETFLFRTGLKGSPAVDQRKIQQILQQEVPNVAEAAREYGRLLANDTQFIYSASNAPAAFRGTIGRMAGQFGMYPVSFGEYMLQNTTGARDAKWAYQFASRWAKVQIALMGMSMSTGIDTSTWLFANPLTFEGGPWFQTFRDISTLGVSTNEFERREASAKLKKVFGNSTAGFMGGIFNPFGGQTTNLFQAMAEEDPTHALLLGLGFNLTDSSLATRRR